MTPCSNKKVRKPPTKYLQYTQLLLSRYKKYGKCTRVAKWTVTGYFPTQMSSETGVKRGWYTHIVKCIYTDLGDTVWPLTGSTSSLWWSRWIRQHETALHLREKDANGERVTRQHETALHTEQRMQSEAGCVQNVTVSCLLISRGNILHCNNKVKK